ncbi:hypothetical protein STEG23_003538 [Scotinomys teguina]
MVFCAAAVAPEAFILNSAFQVMEDIIREIKKYFDPNPSDSIACENVWAEGELLRSEMLSRKGLKASDVYYKDPLPRR